MMGSTIVIRPGSQQGGQNGANYWLVHWTLFGQALDIKGFYWCCFVA